MATRDDWPDRLPDDLKHRLLDALSSAGAGPDDIWDEVRDWLVGKDVRPNERVRTEEPIPSDPYRNF